MAMSTGSNSGPTAYDSVAFAAYDAAWMVVFKLPLLSAADASSKEDWVKV